eukprot:SAG11_NODE_799_length_7127_cov_3.180279_8_plen_86_part_00
MVAVVKLLQFVVEKIIELDAPAYEDDSRAWLQGLIESLNEAALPPNETNANSPQPAGDFADFLGEPHGSHLGVCTPSTPAAVGLT